MHIDTNLGIFMPSYEKTFLRIELREGFKKLEKLLKKAIHNYCSEHGLAYQDFVFPDDGSLIVIDRQIIAKARGDDEIARSKDVLYAPRVDVAIAPFNLQPGTARYMAKICEYIERSDGMRMWLDFLKERYYENLRRVLGNFVAPESASIMDVELLSKRNPRCFVAVEVCFGGSRKHTLGSLVNASLLGYYGVVVTGDSIPRKKVITVESVIRLKYYLMLMQKFKAVGEIGRNTIIVSRDQFLESFKFIN